MLVRFFFSFLIGRADGKAFILYIPLCVCQIKGNIFLIFDQIRDMPLGTLQTEFVRLMQFVLPLQSGMLAVDQVSALCCWEIGRASCRERVCQYV